MPEQTRYVAFYRNMNLGHRGCPNRQQLESALAAAGGTEVRSFQTNGTVVFRAQSGTEADVVGRAAGPLGRDAGYDGAVFVRTFDSLAELIERDPFAAYADERTYRETITFFDGGRTLDLTLPWTNPRGDLDIIELHDSFALSITRMIGSTTGSPNSVLEPRLGVLATTRTMGTIERLVKAIG